MAALLFRRPPYPTPGGVELVFDEQAGPVDDIEVRIHGRLGSLKLAVVAQYDNAVRRGIDSGVLTDWQLGRSQVAAAENAFDQSTPVPVASSTSWAPADRVMASERSALLELHGLALRTGTTWALATVVQQSKSLQWRVLFRRSAHTETAWRNGVPLATPVSTDWQERLPRRSTSRSEWGLMNRLAADAEAPFGVGRRLQAPRWSPWGAARAVPWGVRPVEPPEPPAHVCYPPSSHLLFRDIAPATPHLLFSCRAALPPAMIVIPILRSYIVINEVALVRADDGTVLEPVSLTVSSDVDSWTWGFDATLRGQDLDAVMPSSAGEPVELLATINGISFRLVVEQIGRARGFGAAQRIRVTGRGRAAWLASPYAAVSNLRNATHRTAAQLIGDALTISGVPIGWDVEFGLDDWLVPAGAFAMTGAPIDAVNRIAAAAGGYVQADRVDQTLHILPRYPVAPWDWAAATPDIELPSAVVSREGFDWIERPIFNAVYVSGEAVGVLADVKRAGTAGDLLAPMITDALITHADAARQRALPVFADTGRQVRASLSLPVLESSGVIQVGSLLRYIDGSTTRTGLVRAVSVNAARPLVRQTLEVECHA